MRNPYLPDLYFEIVTDRAGAQRVLADLRDPIRMPCDFIPVLTVFVSGPTVVLRLRDYAHTIYASLISLAHRGREVREADLVDYEDKVKFEGQLAEDFLDAEPEEVSRLLLRVIRQQLRAGARRKAA